MVAVESRKSSVTAVSILLITETWTPSGIFLSGVPGDRSSSPGWKKMPPRMNFKRQHLNRNRSSDRPAGYLLVVT